MKKITLKIAIIIFLVETLIMIALSLFITLEGPVAETIFDATALVVLATPFIYLWVIKPYVVERDLTARDNHRLSSAVDNSASFVLLADASGKIEFANSAYLAMSYFPKKHILNDVSHFRNLIQFQDSKIYSTDYVFKDAFNGEFQFLRAIIKPLWVKASITPITDGYGNVINYYIVAEDISSHKMTETILADARKHAQTTTQAKTHFMAMMSNEITRPLEEATVQLGRTLEADLSKDQRSSIETILTSNEQIVSMLNDLSVLAKIESKQLDLERISFSAQETMKLSFEKCRKHAENKAIELSFNCNALADKDFIGDPNYIQLVVDNFLSNAIKFTDTGSVTLEASTHEKFSTHYMLRVQVSDTGVGVSNTVKHLLSTDSIARAGQDDINAAGLGLALCKHLVLLMEGSIGCKDNEGGGSIFYFEIPLRHTSSVN